MEISDFKLQRAQSRAKSQEPRTKTKDKGQKTKDKRLRNFVKLLFLPLTS